MKAPDPIYGLLERFFNQGNRFSDRFIVNSFTLPRICKPASPEDAKVFADALTTILPPWEGEAILLPLERLGFSLAFGTLALAYPNAYVPEDHSFFMTYAARFVQLVDAELLKQKHFVHRLFAEVFSDRVAAWTVAIHAVRTLLKREPSDQLLGVLVERLLVAGVYKGSLLEKLMLMQLAGQSRDVRQRVASQIRFAVSAGMQHPWSPKLDADDLLNGIDMIVEIAMPAADPRKLFSLLRRVVSREIITQTGGPPEFVSGLITNRWFKAASTRVPGFIPN